MHSTPLARSSRTPRWSSVTDGDTITVSVDGTKEKVRLIGIDTPETKKPDTPVQCFGPEATRSPTSLLPEGTPLHLERDVEARDKYGRLLAYVYRSDDGLFVNLEIVAKGYARLLTIPAQRGPRRRVRGRRPRRRGGRRRPVGRVQRIAFRP